MGLVNVAKKACTHLSGYAEIMAFTSVPAAIVAVLKRSGRDYVAALARDRALGNVEKLMAADVRAIFGKGQAAATRKVAVREIAWTDADYAALNAQVAKFESRMNELAVRDMPFNVHCGLRRKLLDFQRKCANATKGAAVVDAMRDVVESLDDAARASPESAPAMAGYARLTLTFVAVAFAGTLIWASTSTENRNKLAAFHASMLPGKYAAGSGAQVLVNSVDRVLTLLRGGASGVATQRSLVNFVGAMAGGAYGAAHRGAKAAAGYAASAVHHAFTAPAIRCVDYGHWVHGAVAEQIGSLGGVVAAVGLEGGASFVRSVFKYLFDLLTGNGNTVLVTAFPILAWLAQFYMPQVGVTLGVIMAGRSLNPHALAPFLVGAVATLVAKAGAMVARKCRGKCCVTVDQALGKASQLAMTEDEMIEALRAALERNPDLGPGDLYRAFMWTKPDETGDRKRAYSSAHANADHAGTVYKRLKRSGGFSPSKLKVLKQAATKAATKAAKAIENAAGKRRKS